MFYLLIFLIATLQLADIATTLYFLRHSTLKEASPLLLWFFERIGPAPTLFGLKGAYCAAIWYWYASIPEQTLWVVVAILVGVVLWNLHHIQKVKTSEAQMR